MIKKMITVTGEQEEWIEENDLKLSQFVRKRLDEKMKMNKT